MNICLLIIILIILVALVLLKYTDFSNFINFPKMIGKWEAPEINLEQIKELSPKFIYIHGMVASGKSTLSDKLKEFGYKPIHIDDLVREEFPIWPKEIYLDAPDGHLTMDQQKLFARIKKEMNYEKIVIDGFIAPLMWKELYMYKPWDMLIFVQHSNADSYRIAIMKRAIYDLNNNLRTLSSFWRDPRSSDMISEYKEKGKDSELLQQMVNDTSIHKWDTLKDKCTYWTDLFEKNSWPYYLYYIDLSVVR